MLYPENDYVQMHAIHFYGISEPYGFLSNFFGAPMVLDGTTWPIVEHDFQAQKFADLAKQAEIRAAPTRGKAKKGVWAPDASIRADWATTYILMRHGDDPEEAMVQAINDTRDNDTIAALVGAAVGALHGSHAIPERWNRGLLGRLGTDDDGALWWLLEETRYQWNFGPESLHL